MDSSPNYRQLLHTSNDSESTLTIHFRKCPRVHPRVTSPRVRVVRRVESDTQMTIYSRVEPLFRESFQLLYRRFENRSETVSFVPFVFRSENRSKRVKRAETRSETVSSPRNVSCTHMVSRFYLPLLVCPPFCSTAQRLFFSFYSSARPQLEYSIR